MVPQQEDIGAALMRLLNDGDLRKAKHAALTTAISDFYYANNISNNAVACHR